MFVKTNGAATSFSKQNYYPFIKDMGYALVKSYEFDDFLPNQEPSTIIRKRNFRASKSDKPGIIFDTLIIKPVSTFFLRPRISFPNKSAKDRYIDFPFTALSQKLLFCYAEK